MPSSNHSKLLKSVAIASVSLATSLIILKLIIWSLTGSVSVLASSIDSILDLIASLISFFAIKISLKPADEDHHFGHGKAEQLAALAQASFIAGSALYLLIYALDDLFTGGKLQHPNLAIYAMILSSILVIFLLFFQRYVIRITGSIAIQADSLHYAMDLMLNIGVILALILNQYISIADPLMSIIIALIMLWNVKNLGLNAINLLMDKALSAKEHQIIQQIILNDPDVYNVHDLRTRYTGQYPIIQFHLELDANLSVLEAHNIGTRIQNNLLTQIPNADIIYHIDPYLDSS